jgi:hypothetical protein
MKLLLLTLLLALVTPSHAEEQGFEWDAPATPLDGYLASYRLPVGEILPADNYAAQQWGAWVAVTSTDSTEVVADFPDTLFQFGVQSFVLLTNSTDIRGSGGMQKSQFATLTVPLAPPAPNSIRIIAETSMDQVKWSPIVDVVVVIADDGKKFFRTRVISENPAIQP